MIAYPSVSTAAFRVMDQAWAMMPITRRGARTPMRMKKRFTNQLRSSTHNNNNNTIASSSSRSSSNNNAVASSSHSPVNVVASSSSRNTPAISINVPPASHAARTILGELPASIAPGSPTPTRPTTPVEALAPDFGFMPQTIWSENTTYVPVPTGARAISRHQLLATARALASTEPQSDLSLGGQTADETADHLAILLDQAGHENKYSTVLGGTSRYGMPFNLLSGLRRSTFSNAGGFPRKRDWGV
uniref:Uncharacterized protein n=1 Tax=Mycena chlorophos TaxID=658473 RepID=A0ABQ0LEA3_MYCCL|nr:predicted protein [Mycena chlorophos]